MSSNQIESIVNRLDGPVLVTGHTGFKGAWLVLLLQKLGIKVIGVSLPKEDQYLYSNLHSKVEIKEYFFDIRNYAEVSAVILKEKPKFIIHLAAQALVLDSYANPSETFSTNIMGTLNVLEASAKLDTKPKILVATTDKVYKNQGLQKRFIESDSLGGKDPYSWSKVGTESVVGAYQNMFKLVNGAKVVSVRSGNVIGGGDRSKNRLLPDIISGAFENREICIRNPKDTRPWQHVLDPLWGYLLAITTEHSEEAFNFSPQESSYSVDEVVQIAKESFANPPVVKYQQNVSDLETQYLDLDSNKARDLLKWSNKWDQKASIKSTIKWWENVYLNNKSITDSCEIDIKQLLESKFDTN